MAKVCQITGKKGIVGNSVSHSKKHVKRVFNVNLAKRKFYLEEEDRWLTLLVSNKAVRIINKKGLSRSLKDAKANGFIEKY